jgi:predicted dehydrogenase
MTQLGIGIVGGGFMAEVYSRAGRAARAARARLVGLVSSSPARSASAAQSLGVEAAYDSVELLLADPAVDVVHIATPNATHRELALAAIRAGKHVVCEKPLATSVADAAELVAAAATAEVVATVPFAYPMVREARARLAGGGPGRLHSIQGVYLQDWLLDRSDDNWRVDEGQGGPSRAFADIGSHLVDLIEFVTGDRIARVQALTRTVHAERASTKDVTTEDLAAVLFETGSGAVGTLLVSQVAPGRKNRLHVELAGANESVVFDQEHPEALWLGRRAGSEIVTRGEGLAPDAARLSILPSGHPLGFQDAFNAFVADSYAAITGDQRDGLPTFDDGLRAVHITQAVIESASTGAWVDTIGIPA